MVEFDENLNPINGPQPPTPPTPTRPTPPPPSAPIFGSASGDRPNRGNGMFFGLVTIVAIVMLAFVGLNQFRSGSGPAGQPEGIVASAEGLAYVTPNVAKLTFGVSTNGRTITDVTKDMNAAIASTKSALSRFGIQDKDIRTTQYNLYPERDFRAGVSPRILSYSGRHTLAVTIRDLNQVDGVLEAVASSGANEISDLVFTVDDAETALEPARTDAIKKARDKARKMAQDAGVSLGRLISVTEYSQSPDQYYGLGGRGGGSDLPGVESGSIEMKVNVTLTYAVS